MVALFFSQNNLTFVSNEKQSGKEPHAFCTSGRSRRANVVDDASKNNASNVTACKHFSKPKTANAKNSFCRGNNFATIMKTGLSVMLWLLCVAYMLTKCGGLSQQADTEILTNFSKF